MTIVLWFFISSLLIISLVLIVFIRKRFTMVTVLGYSMYPTLQDGDRLLVLRDQPRHKYQTGQIVLSHLPYEGPWKETLYIKRLIGLPNDQVTFHISEVNMFVHSDSVTGNDNEEYITWKIPKDHCFIKGDSRWSEDSVIWGPIPLNLLVGVVLLKLSRHTRVSTSTLLTVKTSASASTPPDFVPANKRR